MNTQFFFTLTKTLTFVTLLVALFGCDLERKKQCEWTLEPEPKLKKKVEKGFIPVCARNRKSQKQDCRLQTTIEFAKKVYGKKFRYTDLEIKSVSIPRTIKHIKFCSPKK